MAMRDETAPRVDGRLLEGLTALASKAGGVICAIAHSERAVRRKADHSPLTAADEASDAVISAGLAQLLPGILVVSEESAKPSQSTANNSCFVLVDPLDGTKEFLANRDDFTVNLALIIDGRPVAGVVAAPALGLLFRGAFGMGAERLRLAAGAPPERAAEVVPIRPRPRPVAGFSALVSRSHLESATVDFLQRLSIAERVPCGSALKFCRIAEGAADIYPRLSPTFEWDVAAGHAVLAASGGAVTRPEGGAIIYGDRALDFRIPAFVAWGDPAAAFAVRRP
jgi:3'(2'), 5'-bisphosphate nucleotidase